MRTRSARRMLVPPALFDRYYSLHLHPVKVLSGSHDAIEASLHISEMQVPRASLLLPNLVLPVSSHGNTHGSLLDLNGVNRKWSSYRQGEQGVLQSKGHMLSWDS